MAERSASVEFLVLCPTNKLHPRACHLSEASLRAKSKDIARFPFVAIFPGQTSAAAKMAPRDSLPALRMTAWMCKGILRDITLARRLPARPLWIVYRQRIGQRLTQMRPQVCIVQIDSALADSFRQFGT